LADVVRRSEPAAEVHRPVRYAARGRPDRSGIGCNAEPRYIVTPMYWPVIEAAAWLVTAPPPDTTTPVWAPYRI